MLDNDKNVGADPLADINFYMKVPLPDGRVTNGKIDYRHLPDHLGIGDAVSGKRVLDIAANDGFWAFWAENAGAADVLAIDVDSFEGYDWGWDGPPASLASLANAPSQWAKAGAGFWALHKLLSSKKVRREQKSIYDLSSDADGTFDLIFNFGLLYHLRHPLLALDRTRAVCRGAMIVETHIVNSFGDLPASLFYGRDELNTISNWTGPNESAVFNWLVSAGYPRVFRSIRANKNSPYARGVFAAVTEPDGEWARLFADNPELIEFDAEHQARTHRETRAILGLPPRV